MNVLIIATNRADQPVSVIPYGACLVAEAVRRAGHNVRLIDLMHDPHPIQTLHSALDRQDPDVVGISARNIDNNDMLDTAEYFSELEPLLAAIRDKTDAPVVLGGPAVGVMPEALLRFTGAELAVPKDGEFVFPEILRAMGNGTSPMEVDGVAWIENGVFRRNDNGCPALQGSAMDPGFGRWVDMRAYRSRMATVPIQSKRGCPFECVYCTYGISEGRTYRLSPPAEVVEAVHHMVADGARDIEFVDNVFNAPYDHALEICDLLTGSPSGARLISMEINPMFLDDRLLEAMEGAGFAGIGVTAESAADPVLMRMGKGFDEAHVNRAAEAVRRSNLPCFWIFMLGGPGETEGTVQRTLRFAATSLRPQDVAFFNLGIRIYPGTVLESIAREEGVLTAPADSMLTPHFYFSPDLDLGWVLNRLRRLTEKHLNMLNPASLSHPWLPAVNRIVHRLPIKPPLWRHTGTIRKIVRFLGRDIWAVSPGGGP